MRVPGGETLFAPSGDSRDNEEEFWHRCWELLYWHWFPCCVLDQYFVDQYLQEGMTVIDIGANVGAFCMAAGWRIGPTGTLVAIEPEEDNLRALRRTLANCSAKVIIIPAAAGRSNERIQLYKNPRASGMHTVVPSLIRAGAGMSIVDQRSVDFLVEKWELPDPSFIKIDVEGAELEVLAGASETLNRCRPVIVAAAYHEPDHPRLIRQFINETVPDYHCELRQACRGAEKEMVAVPRERMARSRW
ncbi:MAG: FkbM family methyltransferase [Candidatus Zipacnadales bacterium]